MKTSRKNAKCFIKSATKTEYLKVVSEAFLTIRQEKILLMKRTNEQIANWEIGNAINVSVETINKEFLIIYDKIAKVLQLNVNSNE